MDGKVNWNRTSAHQIWGKFSYMNAVVDDLTNYLGPIRTHGDGGFTKVYQATAGQTWTLSPTMLMDMTFGFGRQDQHVYGPGLPGRQPLRFTFQTRPIPRRASRAAGDNSPAPCCGALCPFPQVISFSPWSRSQDLRRSRRPRRRRSLALRQKRSRRRAATLWRVYTSRPSPGRMTPPRSGTLARVLQAWEQWDAAHAAYMRAGPWTRDPGLALPRCRRAAAARAAARALEALGAPFPPIPTTCPRGSGSPKHCSSGRTAGEPELFEPLVAVAATEPAALVGLGRIAAAEGRHEEAVRAFERATTLFPELGAAYYGLAPLVPRAWSECRRGASRGAACAVRRAVASTRRSGARIDRHAQGGCARQPATGHQPRRGRRRRRGDRGARDGARPRSLAGAGAREPRGPVRTRPELAEGRGTLPRGRRPGIQQRGHALRLCGRARVAGTSGMRPRPHTGRPSR
jgi:hypothetical protein